MTDISRFLIQNSLFGFLVGVVFAAVLLALDVGKIGTLAWKSDIGFGAVALLVWGMGTTCAAAQIGFALFGEKEEDE